MTLSQEHIILVSTIAELRTLNPSLTCNLSNRAEASPQWFMDK